MSFDTKSKSASNPAFTFSTPAFIEDLTGAAQTQLNSEWNRHVSAFTEQAITGVPWNTGTVDGAGNFTPSPRQSYYFNAASTDIPGSSASLAVAWDAFPNRLTVYCGSSTPSTNPYNLSLAQLWELADTGYYIDQNNAQASFPHIPVNLCPSPDWNGALQPYGPYGPRGWQDEYCEWSVTRNAAGKISRVDFVCENPEYWYTLWRVSPDRVAQLYQDTLNAGLPPGSPNAITVNVADLYLTDPLSGAPVTDPFTGNPAYNPLNKWNRGPLSSRGSNASGGAIHLTATPNTLQTEMGLAGAATVQRTVGNVDPQALICCSQYGQANRNSDPHIGLSVNQVVGGPPARLVSLANPVGLYIQQPDFSNYALPADPNLPAGAKVEDCWHIVRGGAQLTDPVTGQPFPGNFILHAAFQIPAAWIAAGVNFTIGDITLKTGGVATPLNWGAQITGTFQVGLFARGLPAADPSTLRCLVNLDNPAGDGLPPAQAQPVQLMYQSVWNALYATQVPNVVRFPMNLASNSVIVPLAVRQGQRGIKAVLICATAVTGPGNVAPAVTAPGAEIAIAVAPGLQTVTYAAPGNSYPSPFQLLTLSIDIGANVAPGLYGLQVSNPGSGMPPDVAGPAYLNVYAA
ncbi:hypothetical protein [Janthinobacterium agaricidamnosum]|uniref:Uncharacterized protein n=1 Tax=Janthinobacterium agaricidamnosum NBRC 102515 = DSM 9628 TaxID=1349767 RepID=W0V534_9BURK|nr:hypothetical protein [Janthinobacterium agaricidamnosum]CDG82443.1 putative uncharacterized protein [Janthinobacterium agaricidamnosum NBRC 102515 = DSM 9628]